MKSWPPPQSRVPPTERLLEREVCPSRSLPQLHTGNMHAVRRDLLPVLRMECLMLLSTALMRLVRVHADTRGTLTFLALYPSRSDHIRSDSPTDDVSALAQAPYVVADANASADARSWWLLLARVKEHPFAQRSLRCRHPCGHPVPASWPFLESTKGFTPRKDSLAASYSDSYQALILWPTSSSPTGFDSLTAGGSRPVLAGRQLCPPSEVDMDASSGLTPPARRQSRHCRASDSLSALHGHNLCRTG